MQRKRNWIRRFALTLAVTLLALGGLWAYAGGQTEEEDGTLIREREYTAAMGDITVGISVAGKISSTQEPVEGLGGLTLETYLVSVGDWVNEGDPLARYSPESLNQALADAFQACEEAQDALDQARSGQKSGLTALSSRRSSDQKLSAKTYSAYLKALNQLASQLEEDQQDTQKQLADAPEDADLAARLAQVEKELAQVNDLLAQAPELRAAQKAGEEDAAAQAQEDLETIRLLEERVQAAEDNLRAQREGLGQLQQLSRDPILYAPASGVVTQMLLEAGSEVSPGQSILTLGTAKGWNLQVLVEQSDIVSVTEDQPVTLVVNAYPTDTLRGTVAHIKRVAEEDGKYLVTIRVEAEDLALLEGMEAYGTIILAQRENVLTLSNKAIHQQGGAQYVTVRGQTGELEERQVTTGFSDGKVSEITGGLEAGDVALVVDRL